MKKFGHTQYFRLYKIPETHARARANTCTRLYRSCLRSAESLRLGSSTEWTSYRILWLNEWKTCGSLSSHALNKNRKNLDSHVSPTEIVLDVSEFQSQQTASINVIRRTTKKWTIVMILNRYACNLRWYLKKIKWFSSK